MRPARLLIVPIALTIAVVATSPAGATSSRPTAPKAPQLVSQLKDGAARSSAAACPAKPRGDALRVTCRPGRSALVRYTFKVSGNMHGAPAATVSGTGSVRPSVTVSRGTATVSLRVSRTALIKSVSITYYAS